MPRALRLAVLGSLLIGTAGVCLAADEANSPHPTPTIGAPLDQLGRQWRESDQALVERAKALREAGLRLGIPDLDAAARALLLDPGAGPASERARAAALLAPTLPAAQAALARAELIEGKDPMGAARAALRAVVAFGSHLEASQWLAATACTLLVGVALLSAAAFIVLCALLVLGSACHDLGDLFERSMPRFARFALLAALLLLPAAVGEGALGVLLVGFGIAFCYAARAQRAALLFAAALVVGAVHPGVELVARALASLGSDPVAEAAYGIERGTGSTLAIERLTWTGERDPLAARALALQDKRSGRYREAEARYRRLLQVDGRDPRVLNNAANVELSLGDPESAIELYERAVEELRSASIWFNLAQAYGRSIRVEDHELALSYAQSIDLDLVRELTQALATSEGGYVTDLAIAPHEVWSRLLRVPRPFDADALRTPWAPGRLGRSGQVAGLAFLAVAFGALVLGARFEPSRRCAQCGRRICPRCPSKPAAQALCQACARLLHRPETADPSLRGRRLDGMRRRHRRTQRVQRLVSLCVPGGAGLVLGRPFAALLALAGFGVTVGALLAPGRIVPDPLAAGAAGPLLFHALAGLAALATVLITGITLLRGRA